MNVANSTIPQRTVYPILFTIAFTHFINDLLQAIIPSVYPMLKTSFNLSFAQIGMITFTFQVMASLLQPFIGIYTDRKPQPYSLAIGMGFTLAGLILLSQSSGYYSILAAVGCVGIGSSVFHPESSRVAYLASGGKRGLAQSIFQLGGNAGSAAGPLLVALIVIPHGRGHIIWFTLVAILGIMILLKIAGWYKAHLIMRAATKANTLAEERHHLSKQKVIGSVVILLLLIFSKYFYMVSMTNYFTFYLIENFHLSIQQSQLYLFAFLAAVATGTLMGGPLGDRFGRKYVIWFSILGAAPFTLLLPHANLFWTVVLAVIAGVVIASAFSAILVYAQELIPGKVGMVSGLFFGFAFGIAGIGSALLGRLADHFGIVYVFHICAFLPLLGIITGLLPNLKKKE
jgi:MFS transporter, FSR family, fosmidomycin resistance protein